MITMRDFILRGSYFCDKYSVNCERGRLENVCGLVEVRVLITITGQFDDVIGVETF